MTHLNDEGNNARKVHLQPDTLAASVAILLLANVVQRSIGFGRGILFCRWLTPDELGTWEMAYSFLLLASPVVVLGLPGSFGRYLERYRQRGQLRTFLRRATTWTVALTVAAFGFLVYEAPRFSNLIFGRPDAVTLVVIIAISLVAVIGHHYLEAVFSGLRKFSIVSTMHFIQSISFAVFSLSLMWCWHLAAESIVIGYGAACLLSAAVTLAWKGKAVLADAVPDMGVAHRDFWPPLLRFAFWVWVINVFFHLFGVVDRYMLVHFSGLESTAALALVGNYHASRIVPVLFLSVANLLAGAVMPYLSFDWEGGDRRRVSERLNAVLKVTSLAMLAGGVAVLWICPVLFHVSFAARYDRGLAVMPWTMAYCAWDSLLLVSQTYLWCAERNRIAVLPLAIGLLINIGIDLTLIPTWGLLGAVIGTTCATATALAFMYWLSWQAGMRLDRGMILLSIAPAAICGGAWIGTLALLVVVAALPFSRTLITVDERRMLSSLVEQLRARMQRFSTSPSNAREPRHAV